METQYSDANPARRNLVLTSIAFIVYYLGDGRLTEKKLQIQAVSITFDNTTALIVLAWLALFWFALRYYQTNKNLLRKAVRDEVATQKRNPILIAYLKRQTKLHYLWENGFTVGTVGGPRQWIVQIQNIEGGSEEKGRWTNYRTKDGDKFDIRWAWFGLVRLSLLLTIAWKEPGIGSYLVPPALFVVAVLLGITDSLSHALHIGVWLENN